MDEEKRHQFIERRITIGLIVSDDFIKHIARVYTADCLASNIAKIIVGWCFEYFKKYGRAPKIRLDRYILEIGRSP